MTLTQALANHGYTHQKSKSIDGKQDIFKNGEYVGTFSSKQAWDYLRRRHVQKNN